MPKSKTIVKRLGGLIPDLDTIQSAYGVDQKRAKKIQAGLGSLLEFVGDLITEQAEFIEGQAETARMIEKQVYKGRDAKTILDNVEVFLSGDAVTVEHILSIVFVPIFATAFGKLPPERQRELFAALREAINCLKRQDGALVEPE